MRQSLIGTGVGLALGLGAGGVIGFTLGSVATAPEAATTSQRPVPEAAADASADEVPRSAPLDGRAPANRRPLRPERSRVERPPPRPRPTAPPQAQPEPTPRLTADATLHDLAAALRSDGALTAEHAILALQLAAAGDAVSVDLSLVDIALARSTTFGDPAYQIAFTLAGLVTPSDAVAALEAAVAGENQARWLVAYNLADRAALAEEDTFALARALLAHGDSNVRSAGIRLAAASPGDATDALLVVAQTDADGDLRSEALWALLEGVDWESADSAGRAVATPVALLAARKGDWKARYTAVSWFPELGPVAADTALEIVREGGLDDELLGYAIAPILAAGRYRELLEADSTERVVRAAGWWVECVELEGDELRALFPLTDAVLRLDDEDSTHSALWAIGYGGACAELERIAADRTLPGQARAGAAAMLFSKDLDAELYDDAERRGLRALRGLVDPVSANAATRRLAVAAFTERGATIEGPAILTAVRALLRQVALGDPNAWVRDEAVEALEYLADEE